MGLTNRMLQILLTAWYVFTLINGQMYEKREQVRGRTQSFVGAGDLHKHSSGSAGELTALLCNNTRRYWYHNAACDGADLMAASTTSCEYNITCEDLEYAEMTRKQGEHEIYVFTYMKDTLYKVFPCPLKNQYPCEADEAFWNGEEGHCKCWRTSNQFLEGVERMTFTIIHNIDALRELSVPLTDEQRSGLEIPTVIVKDSIDGEIMHTFAAGERITADMDQWLKWAGVTSLDSVNPKALAHYPPTFMIPGSNNEPTYRMTGVELSIELNYIGTIGTRGLPHIECKMVVKAIQGYHSFGSHPVYIKYKDSNGAKTVSDQYTRGIRISLNSKGTIGEFSLNALLFLAPNLLVYIALAPTITEYIFYYFGVLCELINAYRRRSKTRSHQPNFGDFMSYESQTWHQSCDENVSLDGFHAKRLLNTLMLNMLFQVAHAGDRLTYPQALDGMLKLLTKSRTANTNTSELKERCEDDEQDARRLKTKVLGARDAERLVSWLFHISHPELRETPVQERTISVNRFATLLSGGVEHPTLAECVTHVGLDAQFTSLFKMSSLELSALQGSFPGAKSKAEVNPVGASADTPISVMKLPGEIGEE
eukprot:TRINITY_DN89728_c0_g1_i1.p1 TRINITY_DN89728_c0_g1~~TRINITY_DN89728_c0_g1_i1.p1  ORF type:complete len:646 (+),score=73.75 TRINITY_DN89728_c0_g1_i1:158-1939(+)